MLLYIFQNRAQRYRERWRKMKHDLERERDAREILERWREIERERKATSAISVSWGACPRGKTSALSMGRRA